MDKEQIEEEYKDTFDCVYQFLNVADSEEEFGLRKKLLEQLVNDAHHLASMLRIDQGKVAAHIIDEWAEKHPDAEKEKPMPVTPAGSEPDRKLEPVKRGPGRPKKVHP